MSITVTDGSKYYLNYYTVLNIKAKNLDLLLGVPYLSSIKVKIDISNYSIEIGDKKREENRVTIRTPLVKLVTLRITRRLESRAVIKEVDESSKEENEDKDEDEDKDKDDNTDERGSSKESSDEEKSKGEADF
ncbi:hypothetical protein LTR27_007502 [Elasticomyces elasticus]|nr:hypothetical protein LTR27_007502 [Elasticomyces elasticus]